MFSFIPALFEAIKQIFSYAEKSKEKLLETDIVKTKKNLWKKSDLQEDLILDMAVILQKYVFTFSTKDQKKVLKLLKKIKKVN